MILKMQPKRVLSLFAVSLILKIQQTKKELFSAAFDILHKEERVGTISVSGKLGSMEADIRVNVFGNIFTMKYAGGLFAEQKIKKGYKSYNKRFKKE